MILKVQKVKIIVKAYRNNNFENIQKMRKKDENVLFFHSIEKLKSPFIKIFKIHTKEPNTCTEHSFE